MICSSKFLYIIYIFFFFKQKTAYEMRISDWSSDVCSSDLVRRHRRIRMVIREAAVDLRVQQDVCAWQAPGHRRHGLSHGPVAGIPGDLQRPRALHVREDALDIGIEHQDLRSEEHTSELQSLMRNTYAVFCLKKK